MRMVMIFLLLTGFAPWVSAGFSVIEIDFLEKSGLQFNGAGPLLMQVDEARNRLVTANTLSSSVSVIDCETGDVVNIRVPLRRCALRFGKCVVLPEGTVRRRSLLDHERHDG